jgi:uncharacterized protein
MKMCSFRSQPFRFPIFCLAIVTLIALACSTPAFCGEIHDAAKTGDLARVKALLKENPELVSSRDEDGKTPLHLAIANSHKDITELLRRHGGHE